MSLLKCVILINIKVKHIGALKSHLIVIERKVRLDLSYFRAD